jgi:glycosyltransferase involved in cell wall biosynthesis
MRLRLLVLTAAYPSSHEPGRGIFIENLNRELLEQGGAELSLTVVAPRVHSLDPASETRFGVEVRRFPYPSGGKRLKELDSPGALTLGGYFLSGLSQVLWEARGGDYDAVLCHWVLPTGPIAWLSSFFLECPFFLFAHGSDLNRYAARSSFLRQASRLALNRATGVFAVSEDLRKAIETDYSPGVRQLEVVEMGVGEGFQPSDRGEAREALGLSAGLDVLFVGDLIESKGVGDLLEALELLGDQRPDFRLHFAGSGPLEQEIGGTAGCELLGSLSQEELARWYSAADLLVLPSHSEGSPLVVMEALSCGTPVLATNVGGVPQLIEAGRNGELVSPRQPEALAEKLLGLLESPGALEKMREVILGSGRDFSARRCARRVYDSLRSSLSTKGEVG